MTVSPVKNVSVHFKHDLQSRVCIPGVSLGGEDVTIPHISHTIYDWGLQDLLTR